VKAHYCGESPYGEGPDDGCAIVYPKGSKTGVEVIAHFACEWRAGQRTCRQYGQLASETRSVVMGELRRSGLPGGKDKETYFNVWKSPSTGWLIAEGYHQGAIEKDDSMTLCQVILLMDPKSGTIVLRKLPFTKTDADMPRVTTWKVLGMADADNDGHSDIILEGDAYEDHWFEVDVIDHGAALKIFSGLGYYL
jgi:hypothetical protein